MAMHTTGNVLCSNRISDGTLASDFHMHLSAANLMDNLTLYLAINGVNQGTVRDEYSSTAVFAEAALGTVTFTSLDAKTFTFTVVGKNAASTGYNVAVDSIRLVRQ